MFSPVFLIVLIFAIFDQIFLTHAIRLVGWLKNVNPASGGSLDVRFKTVTTVGYRNKSGNKWGAWLCVCRQSCHT